LTDRCAQKRDTRLLLVEDMPELAHSVLRFLRAEGDERPPSCQIRQERGTVDLRFPLAV
jgi:hypothetical protein